MPRIPIPAFGLALTLAALAGGGVIGATRLGDAQAGTLGVSPTRIDLPPAAPAATTVVRNESEAPVLIQVETFEWEDQPFLDQLKPTRELVAVPPMTEIAPGGEQIIRVARRTPFEGSQEAAYRLLITEVPRAGPDGMGVQLALRISLPVFVTPRGTAPQPRFALREAGGRRVLELANTGTAHLQVTDVTVEGRDGTDVIVAQGATYILPGKTVEWDLPEQTAGLKAVPLRALTNIGELDRIVPAGGG